ncbi:MAG TPA: class I SAM-dependent methyltransferase [Acidobacteriaceae bacterium]|nr:class I SAM-dependent methyltransferase [Acidobacteriaceae bacterium]
MDEARPSRTALHVALRRAAHQIYDARPLIFEDPFAMRILGPHAAELERTPGRNSAFRPRPSSVGLRSFLVARSRYAEDQLARAVAAGVTQYVILGAGLDTFALRNPYPHLRVFEVDHPATQAWKRDLLHHARLALPASARLIPVDFEHQPLAAQLSAAGFDPRRPAFFSWLGVVLYLTLDAFRSTISFIASMPPGTGLVFDYAQPRSALSPVEQLQRDSLSSRVDLAGESFRLFFTPGEIAGELTAFRSFEDLGAPEINARYFHARPDSLRIESNSSRFLSVWR